MSSSTDQYDEVVATWKRAYTEMLQVCEKHQLFSINGFGDISEMARSAQGHLLLIEWYEKYGLKIDHMYNPLNRTHIDLGSYRLFSYFADATADREQGSGRFISWPDDGSQPHEEWLFSLSFPSGAYIFGDDYDYQKDVFRGFIDELKGYIPDYSDTTNSHFYWKLENAKSIFEDFESILHKHKVININQLNARRAAKLRAELAALEAST